MTNQLKNSIALVGFAIVSTSAFATERTSVSSNSTSTKGADDIRQTSTHESTSSTISIDDLPSSDYDGNGVTTHFDLARFMADFNAGDPAADYNRDGTVGILDLLGFIDEWNYETQPVAFSVQSIDLSPTDTDADGLVTNWDLARFLAEHGNNDPAADFDGNGTIDIRDLLGFLDGWTTNNVTAARTVFIPADHTADGIVSAFDLNSFMADYGFGAPEADYNRDGKVTVRDMLSFLDDYWTATSGS